MRKVDRLSTIDNNYNYFILQYKYTRFGSNDHLNNLNSLDQKQQKEIKFFPLS